MKKSDAKIHVMKKFGILLFLGISLSSSAQNEIDALRYSQTTFGGTAKFMAMAGSWGALGGEISTLSVNPGGIGIYRKNEITVTPTVFSQNVTSTYNGSTNTDNKLNLNLENIGFILSNNWGNNDKGHGWMTFNIGFAYNKINNFNSRVIIDGTNNTSSLLNSFATNSTGSSPSQLELFSTQLAFATNLIDTIPGTLDYVSAIPAGSVLQQKKTIETSGSMGETVISAGGNYLNKLFLGITVGFSTINYSEQSTYREITALDSLSFAFHNSLTTRGNGINFKFGVIYQPADWLRLGGAIHSSTFYTLSDRWNSDIAANFNNLNHGGVTFTANSPEGLFDYRLTTPLKIIGSVGFRLLKMGLIKELPKLRFLEIL